MGALTVGLSRLVASTVCTLYMGLVSQDAPVSRPQIVAETYVWAQYYDGRGEHLEDHLDDAFAATARAGFNAVQAWLSWYGTAEQAAATTAALARHQLSMPAAYTDGPLHDDRADATIDRIAQWASRGRPHGLRTVVMSLRCRRGTSIGSVRGCRHSTSHWRSTRTTRKCAPARASGTPICDIPIQPQSGSAWTCIGSIGVDWIR
jgi:hypothetical protein